MASLGKSGAILVFILSFHYFYSRNIKTLKLHIMSNNISRRNFLRLSALGTSAMMIPSAANALEAPLFAPAKKKGSANDKINLGFIGLGQQAINLMNGFITIPNSRGYT